MNYVHMVAWWLLIIGGLNWLLVGLLSWDIGMLFGGPGEIVSRVIYVLVGLSALYLLFSHFMGKKGNGAPMQGAM